MHSWIDLKNMFEAIILWIVRRVLKTNIAGRELSHSTEVKELVLGIRNNEKEMYL